MPSQADNAAYRLRLAYERRKLALSEDWLGSRLRWKLRYKWPSQLRCLLGIHTLRAHRAPLTLDQVEAVPMNPRSRPGPGDHRVCTWCGARWKGAYDGIEPHWRRA